MSMRRRSTPPSFLRRPRDCLCPAAQATVDTILKGLKKSKRQCKTNLNALNDELEILERLYYKGKNQHSTSLVWKRIAETRRYAQRVSQSAPLTILDSLHLAFFEIDGPAQKTRGPWSQFPESDGVLSISSRLTSILQLIEKSHHRFEECYRHLTIAMQSGAFVQFLVLFAAVVSRLHIISQALHYDISLCNSLVRELAALFKDAPRTEKLVGVEEGSQPIQPRSSHEETASVTESVTPLEPVIVMKASLNAPPPTVVKPKKKRKKVDEIDAIFAM